ncbi:hypothetical protein FBULB1_6778 [Fusarium bulbicola]|nr:hypothetical protein FBULB1_6778 [Fusarium bulbicola]
MERLDIQESVVTLLQYHKTVQQNLEEVEAKRRKLQGKKEIIDTFGDSALKHLLAYLPDRLDMLQPVTVTTDSEIIDKNYGGAIRSFLYKERKMQELAAELALERDSLGKELQRDCDADLRRTYVEVEKMMEEERGPKSRFEAIMNSIEPYAQHH